MSKIVERRLALFARQGIDGGDWRTIDRLTGGYFEPTESGTDSTSDGTEGHSPLDVQSTVVPCWVNKSNVTTARALRAIFADDECSKKVPQLLIEKSVSFGFTAILGKPEVLAQADVNAASLAIPYDPLGDMGFYYREPSVIELVYAADSDAMLVRLLKEVTLPRQVRWLQEQYTDVPIVVALTDQDIEREIFSEHGFKLYEPPLEFLQRRELMGVPSTLADTWMKSQ